MDKEEFTEKVRRFGRKHRLWRRGGSILAAVSGGPDSLALLLALSELAPSEGFRLGCCTVDHRLREEAEEETAFVASVCRGLGVPCWRETADVPAWRRAHGGSEETAARELRYAALRKRAAAEGFEKIAAAHHMGDQAETVLYHFLRGSGMTGLSGMRPEAENIIRPFLGVTRKEIEAYLAFWPYEPRHDRTNDLPCAVRNRLRLETIPALEAYNLRLTEALCRTAEILREEDSLLERLLDGREKDFVRRDGGISAEQALFRELPDGLARRMIRRIWERCGGRVPDFEETERVLAFLRNAGTGKKTSAAGTMAEARYGQLFFSAGSTRAGRTKNEAPPEWELLQEVRDEKPEAAGPDQLVLDADAAGPVRLRYPLPGDRFAPAGSKVTKKLFPYMNELHIPAEARRTWPLAAGDNHIYWIGFRKAGRYGAPSAETKRYLLLTLRRKQDEEHDERH